MLDSRNSRTAMFEGIPSRSLGAPVVVGGACQVWRLNDRMPLFFDVIAVT
jgi:hypothetical protein